MQFMEDPVLVPVLVSGPGCSLAPAMSPVIRICHYDNQTNAPSIAEAESGTGGDASFVVGQCQPGTGSARSHRLASKDPGKYTGAVGGQMVFAFSNYTYSLYPWAWRFRFQPRSWGSSGSVLDSDESKV